MMVAAADHMTGSLDTLICIKVQHNIELTRTKIMINTHIPLPEANSNKYIKSQKKVKSKSNIEYFPEP